MRGRYANARGERIEGCRFGVRVAIIDNGPRKGGEAKVPKGTAVLSDEERKERGRKGAEARWGKTGSRKKANAKKK